MKSHTVRRLALLSAAAFCAFTAGIAATATADGYTWVVGSVAPIVLNPLFYKTNYQSLRDFEPVSLIASAPQLIAGEVQVAFADMPVALPHVKSGKLRAIAVAGAKPFPLTPGLPTAIEAGLPGFALDNWWGLLTMKGVPQKIISKVNAEIVRALKQPDVIERYTALGIESVTSTPQEFAGIIKSDLAKYPPPPASAPIRICRWSFF